MTIAPGTRIRDNDPRSGGRTLVVMAVPWSPEMDTHVYASVDGTNTASPTRIHRDRIHADGKPRRSGWSVVG